MTEEEAHDAWANLLDGATLEDLELRGGPFKWPGTDIWCLILEPMEWE